MHTDSSQANPNKITPNKSIAKNGLYGQIPEKERKKKKTTSKPQGVWSVRHRNSRDISHQKP